MYFDNYLNPKPPSYNFNYSTPSGVQYNQHLLQNTETIAKGNFKPKLIEKQPINNFNQQFNTNQSSEAGTYETFINQSTSVEGKTLQKSVYPSFLNSQGSNLVQNHQNKTGLKRRDSNTVSNYFKQHQIMSPSYHGDVMQSNINPTRENYRHQTNYGLYSIGRANMSTTNLNKIDSISLKDQHRSTILETNPQKNLKYQQETNKGTTRQNLSTSQLKYDQSKFPPKSYAIGFKGKNQSLGLDTKRNKTSMGYQDKQMNEKNYSMENKELAYNLQLKNTSPRDWSIFSKQNQQGGESNQYTSFIVKKKESLSLGMNKQGNNEPSKDDKKESGLFYQKGINETSRELISKSPSIDTLLSNTYYKDTEGKKSEKSDMYKFDNEYKPSMYTTQQRTSSQSYLQEKTQKQPKESTSKNYQTLISNLQKKFSQQKISADSFQVKEKELQKEINKRDNSIKRLQSIIESHQETISSLEQTLNNFKKKGQLQVTQNNYTSELKACIEQLKQENTVLRDELNRERKKSSLLFNQDFSDNRTESYQLKVKLLEKALAENQKQSKNKDTQIASIRQTYSTLHQSYQTQFNQHQSTKQQLRALNSKNDELKKTLESKTEIIQQLSKQAVYLQSKYEGSLEKLFSQNSLFQNQKSALENTVNRLKIQNQTFAINEDKLKSKIQQLQNELIFKSMEIQNLQEKVIDIPDSENYSNGFPMSEQLQNMKSKLIQKQQKMDQLTLELKTKTKVIQQIVNSKNQLQSQLESYEIKIKKLQNSSNSNTQHRHKRTDNLNIRDTLLCQVMDQKEMLALLNLYHEKYSQIVNLFKLLQKNQETGVSSLKETLQDNLFRNDSPSKEYLAHFHPLIADEIKKIFKDLKKLVLALKQLQSQSQIKNQRLYELDKTLKKQGNKIGSLVSQIHMKNSVIVEINKMQLEKEISKLNQKYHILNQITN